MRIVAGEFNPYQKWFGVRCEGRPDHYRLLGLSPYEDDRETISHAADSRMEYVRGQALSDYQDIAQRVLNELAAAKVCLLTPAKRAAYDRELRAKHRRWESDTLPPKTSPGMSAGGAAVWQPGIA